MGSCIVQHYSGPARKKKRQLSKARRRAQTSVLTGFGQCFLFFGEVYQNSGALVSSGDLASFSELVSWIFGACHSNRRMSSGNRPSSSVPIERERVEMLIGVCSWGTACGFRAS